MNASDILRERSIDWPCPRCGSPSDRHPADGYQRVCRNCGHAGAFEQFAGKLNSTFTEQEG